MDELNDAEESFDIDRFLPEHEPGEPGVEVAEALDEHLVELGRSG
jgi:hypothetical protein